METIASQSFKKLTQCTLLSAWFKYENNWNFSDNWLGFDQ